MRRERIGISTEMGSSSATSAFLANERRVCPFGGGGVGEERVQSRSVAIGRAPWEGADASRCAEARSRGTATPERAIAGKYLAEAALRPIRESFARGRTCCAATARPADLLDANERAAARRSVPAVMADMAPTLRVCAGRVWRERVERARKAGLSKKRVWTSSAASVVSRARHCRYDHRALLPFPRRASSSASFQGARVPRAAFRTPGARDVRDGNVVVLGGRALVRAARRVPDRRGLRGIRHRLRFPRQSSSGEDEDDEAEKNPYLAAIASPGTRARRDSRNTARPPSPSPSPNEDVRSARHSRVETETKPSTSETATHNALEPPARVAPPSPTAFRAVSDPTRGTDTIRVGNGPEHLDIDIDIDIDRAERSRRRAETGSETAAIHIQPTLDRRVDALEREYARLAATVETLVIEKKNVDARLERIETRAKDWEARIQVTDALSPEPNRNDRRADVAPTGADGDVPEHHLEHLVEIDRDSVAAIERAVEEATRTAMRSADARSVVESAVAAATSDAVAAARRELKAELEASCGRLVTELTNRTKDERDETERLLASERARFETRLETRIAAFETEAQNAALELERRLVSRIETRLENEKNEKTREIRDETERVEKASAAAETRLREAVSDALASVASEKVKNAEDARTAAARARAARGGVEAIVAETEARAPPPRFVRAISRVVAAPDDTIAAAEDAPRRVAAIEGAVADVVDASPSSSPRSRRRRGKGGGVRGRTRAPRAATSERRAGAGGPDARAARNASAASANNADAFATPAFVSSARAADSRARAEATARRLAASVDALRDDVVALSREIQSADLGRRRAVVARGGGAGIRGGALAGTNRRVRGNSVLARGERKGRRLSRRGDRQEPARAETGMG